MTLILLIIGLGTTTARAIEPLYSAHCAALLENQVETLEPAERERLGRLLGEVIIRAERARETIWPAGDGPPAVVGGADAIHPVNLWMPAGRKFPDRQMLISFRHVNERLEELRKDVTSIREGYSAGGIVKRGRDEIVGHLQRVDRATLRNEAELGMALDGLPYVTRQRLLLHGLSIGGVVGSAAGLIYALGESAVHFDLSVGQIVVGGSGVALLTAVGPFALKFSFDYLLGFFSSARRKRYEEDWGRRLFGSAYHRLAELEMFAKSPATWPNAFIYLSEYKVLTEAEMLELRQAARAGRAPSLDVVRELEDGGEMLNRTPTDYPVSYVFRFDRIYMFDKDRGEPVFLSFDRFERHVNMGGPPRRKDDRSTSAIEGWAPGALSAAR